MSALQSKHLKKQGQPITKLTVSQRELEKMNATDGDFMWMAHEGIVHVLPAPTRSSPRYERDRPSRTFSQKTEEILKFVYNYLNK